MPLTMVINLIMGGNHAVTWPQIIGTDMLVLLLP